MATNMKVGIFLALRDRAEPIDQLTSNIKALAIETLTATSRLMSFVIASEIISTGNSNDASIGA